MTPFDHIHSMLMLRGCADIGPPLDLDSPADLVIMGVRHSLDALRGIKADYDNKVSQIAHLTAELERANVKVKALESEVGNLLSTQDALLVDLAKQTDAIDSYLADPVAVQLEQAEAKVKALEASLQAAESRLASLGYVDADKSTGAEEDGLTVAELHREVYDFIRLYGTYAAYESVKNRLTLDSTDEVEAVLLELLPFEAAVLPPEVDALWWDLYTTDWDGHENNLCIKLTLYEAAFPTRLHLHTAIVRCLLLKSKQPDATAEDYQAAIADLVVDG